MNIRGTNIWGNLMFTILVEYCQRMNKKKEIEFVRHRLSIKILSFFSKITHVPHAFAHTLTSTRMLERGRKENNLRGTGVQTHVVDARVVPQCWDQGICAWIEIPAGSRDTDPSLNSHSLITLRHEWRCLQDCFLLFHGLPPSLSTSLPPSFSSPSLPFGCELKVSTHASHGF